MLTLEQELLVMFIQSVLFLPYVIYTRKTKNLGPASVKRLNNYQVMLLIRWIVPAIMIILKKIMEAEEDGQGIKIMRIIDMVV